MARAEASDAFSKYDEALEVSEAPKRNELAAIRLFLKSRGMTEEESIVGFLRRLSPYPPKGL